MSKRSTFRTFKSCFLATGQVTHLPSRHFSLKNGINHAEDQIKRYAAAPRVEALRQDTELHKIIMQFDGWKLRRMDEVK